MGFITVNRLFHCFIRTGETGVGLDIVLTDISTNQYFYDRHMHNVSFYANRLLQLRSEESIWNGDHLEWVNPFDSQDWWEWKERYSNYYFQLRDIYSGHTYASINGTDYKHDVITSCELAAKREQVNDFREAERYLSEVDGLMYAICDPDGNLITPSETNAPNAGDYRKQPVYYIISGNGTLQSSQSDEHWVFFPYDRSGTSVYYNYDSRIMIDSSSIYLAYSADAVNAQNRVYEDARSGYVRDLSIAAVSGVLAIALLVILLLGAGRKYAVGDVEDAAPAPTPKSDDASAHDLLPLSDGKDAQQTGAPKRKNKPAHRVGGQADNKLYFTIIDKPYLDISLAFVIVWTVAMMYISGWLLQIFLHNNNTDAIYVLLAAGTTAIISPFLLWLMSFAKRVKAGRFWRYTLVYVIPSKFLRFCMKIAKSLWAGLRLVGKVALIVAASSLIMVIVAILGYEATYSSGAMLVLMVLGFAALIAFLLLRYARRIYKLEEGARAAAESAYDTNIEVGGGELGSIASSIKSIQAGINTAVEQRMKSERLKTELITNVSHDIRTPLTSIITYTDLLKHEGLDCEKAPEYLDILISKSQRLKTLTEELFEAAKAATGNIEVNITQLDIVSLINQVLGELDGAIKSSGLDMRVNLPERLLVNADGKMMWRVMENLLSNVFKYSLKGSRVYLDVVKQEDGVVTQGVWSPGSYARIELKNISANELNVNPAELTERFKRGDDSRADGGSGLGLSIVQSFMSAQGGGFEISIDGDLFKATLTLGGTSPP